MKNLNRILLIMIFTVSYQANLLSQNFVSTQFSTYQPNDNTPVKFVKVHFHFIRDANGLNGFSESDGILAAAAMLKGLNQKLANMPVPINIQVSGQTVQSLPAKYRYVIYPLLNDNNDPDKDGVYFHNDVNYYSGRDEALNILPLLDQSGISDHVVNIFVITGTGSTIGIGVTHLGAYNLVIQTNAFPYNALYDWSREYNGLNHELGHTLTLRHTWGGWNGIANDSDWGDECDDTPVNNNCHGLNSPGDHDNTITNRTITTCCDNINKVTNNLMDYDNLKSTLTPCQLGQVHSYLSNPIGIVKTIGNYYSCPPSSNAISTFYGLINSDITANILSNTSGPISSTSISFQQNNTITFKAMSSIKLTPGFNVKPSASGNKFTAKIENLCTLITLNTNEATWDANHQNLFGVRIPGSARIGKEATNDKILNSGIFKIYPNPTDGTFTIDFLSSEATYEVQIVDLLGNVVLKENVSNTSTKDYSLANLSNGMYIVNLTGAGIQKRMKVQVMR